MQGLVGSLTLFEARKIGDVSVELMRANMLRPYKDLYEFRKDFKIGEIVSIKHKYAKRIFDVMYLGDSYKRNDSDFKVFDVEINLGGKWFSLEELFNEYEYFCWDAQENKNILKPFGV